jgi:hypothetical protein|tara:strand:+ start:2568 stop:2930 length:363 start_codon:yes stop_codon:yes gene_type:complete
MATLATEFNDNSRLYKELLTIKGFQNIDDVIEVCKQTINPTLALEKLVGIYQDPEISLQSYQSIVEEQFPVACRLNRYDPFNNKVYWTSVDEKHTSIVSLEEWEKGANEIEFDNDLGDEG